MLAKLLPLLFLLFHILQVRANEGFTFNGFDGKDANLTVDGQAAITPEGLLRLTNGTKILKGHAMYSKPIAFRRSPSSRVFSFSTTFVFAIHYTEMSGHGIVFFVSPTADFSQATGSQYLGLFNASNNGDTTNHILGVELDTILNPEFKDISTNHVGIDVNGLNSTLAANARYYREDPKGGGRTTFENLTLTSGDPMQVWVEYDGESTEINVTMSPLHVTKPKKPLLSSKVNLSNIFPTTTTMHVGFSSSSDPFITTHYILGWSFRIPGEAELLLSALPSIPKSNGGQKQIVATWVPVVAAVVVVLVVVGIIVVVRRRVKFSEVTEEWEKEHGPCRFSYKTLYDATGGFGWQNLLGSGGFGGVYKGTLPSLDTPIAVKRISHESRQGIKEFVAEIVSMGRLRHRNLVQLHGYCRREKELMLVYELMPNGSLDKLIFNDQNPTLDWTQRLNVIKGVATGLLYLHEGGEKVVIHRDIKASNVLLDKDFNAKLGDFGLARLYDHGGDMHTTHVVGTMGYLAPELTRTGKATKATDVFAFGVFVLEVVCGRRPIETRWSPEELVLVDWVVEKWKRGEILDVVDQRMIGGRSEEVELVLKLGLLCSHPLPVARPKMRQVVRVLGGEVPLQEMPSSCFDTSALALFRKEGSDQDVSSSIGVSSSTGSVIFSRT